MDTIDDKVGTFDLGGAINENMVYIDGSACFCREPR